jgi:immune inhibitor A
MRRALARGLVVFATVAAMGGLTQPTASVADAIGSAGDGTITLPINDSAAGGTYDQDFTRVYAGETPDGTPVYIYVPEGTPLNGDAPTGVESMDPQFDHNTTDAFEPCADATAEEFTITQAQVDYLGDKLADQIVAVDEEHFGEMDAADATDPASDSLVMVLYNIQDDNYYDCSVTSYTAGYFAPDFIDSAGMNVIVVDTLDWANRVGANDAEWRDDDPANDRPELYEGTVAHELEHLLHNYTDPGELSWVDEGLADFAIFLNGFETGGSHLTYHQVFHRETSLTRWAGGLENYGAAYTYFQYLWEQAGGNGAAAGADQFAPDLTYSGTGGDLLIKRIFEAQGNDMAGVDQGIDAYNAETGSDLRSAAELFKDWSVAIYLDDEGSPRFDIKSADFGTADSGGWTIDIANDEFYDDRGNYQGRQPGPKWDKLKNRAPMTALPFGTSYETFRNAGPSVSLKLDGQDAAQVAPHSGTTHHWGGYASQSDTLLNVVGAAGGQTLGFWNWHFIEEGWDYGFVEAMVGGEWVTVPVTDDAGTVVSSNDDPHGNNTEGNGITGTSGGEYFVDDPEYVHYNAQLPAGATAARFRYSTDAAYLDTGWFIDDVTLGTTPAAVTPDGDGWIETTGEQNNNWTGQVVASCDLTPGQNTEGEIQDGAGNFVYRFEGDDISSYALNTKCAGSKNTVAVVISNLPTGDLTVLDADYTLALVGTGKGT